MTHGSLFSGIGGFDLAAEWMGWHNVFHCELNPFCQKILHQYWPGAISYTDIKETDFTSHYGTIDVLTGGFPCQPYSTAGKRKGKEDERHLWPEMLRAIREIRPRWIVGENVRGLISWNDGLVFDEVQSDLEAEGYEVFPVVLPAAGVNAPHQRYRIWFIAYSGCRPGDRRQDKQGDDIDNWQNTRWSEEANITERLYLQGITSNTNDEQRRERRMHADGPETTARYAGPRDALHGRGNSWDEFPTQSPVCGGNDGVPNRVDRIKALGNAIVPQVAYEIFQTIEMYELLY